MQLAKRGQPQLGHKRADGRPKISCHSNGGALVNLVLHQQVCRLLIGGVSLKEVVRSQGMRNPPL
ncbi:hypothetical protein HPB52_003587 [Rhipicephalus sanguineus]|uniref:Uncharacterized protein n=1 Tax=Rhipicephalus sanguineus TaxID=34632 RepID=A0A9D4QGA0_RHISA|nr:hypothetical protein HPB52_003587 [Rhipicephalus sanguineus]